MSFRFEIILFINVLQLALLWALWRIVRRLSAVQEEVTRMVGEATRDLIDRSQELHQILRRYDDLRSAKSEEE